MALAWQWLGRVEYGRVLADQLAARERVWAGTDDGVVLLCEHPPVITLGRSADRSNILASPEELDAAGVTIEQIERGGDVTYHGPGQLMIYPVVKLRRVVDFLERVAGAIVDACTALGGAGAAWQSNPAGVWKDGAKLAACGIHVARGVSIHGFALDVATPREAWARIRPCGLATPQVSLVTLRRAPIAVETVAPEVGTRVVTALAADG